MKITYYNSADMVNTTTEKIKAILGMLEPEELTDEDRNAIRKGEFEPLCNFYSENRDCWIAVPWHWVIEVDE